MFSITQQNGETWGRFLGQTTFPKKPLNLHTVFCHFYQQLGGGGGGWEQGGGGSAQGRPAFSNKTNRFIKKIISGGGGAQGRLEFSIKKKK